MARLCRRRRSHFGYALFIFLRSGPGNKYLLVAVT